MKKFNGREMNLIFRIVDENANRMKKDEYFELTKEMIEENNYYDEGDENVLELAGYQVKIKVKGDHRNDGQMVDYGFYFKNSEDKVTIIWTEMCLVCHWNHHDDEEIE